MQRAGALLQRHGRVWRAPRWTCEHRAWLDRQSFAEPALTLAAEVADFRRFPSAPAFMGFTGLTPSEYSSGARTRRGGITKAGPQLIRSTLIEAARACRHRPATGATLRRRQAGCAAETLARSWRAQQRLHATYAKLTRRGKIPPVAVTAVARELAGFVRAEMTS